VPTLSLSLLTASAEEGIAAAMTTLRLNGPVAILQTSGFPLQSKCLGQVAVLLRVSPLPQTPDKSSSRAHFVPFVTV
jgi:hypothetical protein